MHFAKRLRKHIGEDLKYGNLRLLAIQLGMSYDIGLQIMDTYAPHEYYDKVFEYFLNGLCAGEATPARLIFALVTQKGFGRFLCHICDMWGKLRISPLVQYNTITLSRVVFQSLYGYIAQ